MLNTVYQPLLLSGPSLNIIALSISENRHTHTYTQLTHHIGLSVTIQAWHQAVLEAFLFLRQMHRA